MGLRRLLTNLSLMGSVTLGVASGLALAMVSAPTPAFSYDRTAIISWRGNGDTLPTNAATVGWAGPMFYTNATEGALPTGHWAPGDAVSRVLTVKNVDADDTFQLDRLQVRLAGDAVLAPRLTLSVQNQLGQTLYAGTLADFAAQAALPLNQPLRIARGAQEDLTFTVTFDREANNTYQARNLTAHITLVASQVILPLMVDVHPGSWPNPINPGSRGNTPVAVNGSATMDVRHLNWHTARFGPGQATPLRYSYEDWNGDGYPDLLLKFDTQESGFQCGMTDAHLSIRNQDGTLYEGSDPIVTPPCR